MKPERGYLNKKELEKCVKALKEYVKKGKITDRSQKKDLLETATGEKALVEVVFKSIPSNSKTYIHTMVLPHHWRLQLQPEDYEIAVFVRHRPPETEAQKIQFKKDRDLDIDNTHSYYQELFSKKLDPTMRARISRIISVKELATEFNTFQKLDRLAKTFDLFLSDKQLMANKMNPLPRRLGRRFWVREKKVPLMVKLESDNLDERFEKVLSTEPFYVLGRSSTEQMQIGQIDQSTDHLIENLQAFLGKLYDLYGSGVRFIRLKTTWGLALPIYADLDPVCPKVVMKKFRIRHRPVIDDFEMLEEDAKISVSADGTVRVLREKRKELSDPASSSAKPKKKLKKSM